MSEAIDHEDVLALLEPGPIGAGHVAAKLRVAPAKALWTLKRMARAGLVKRVGADQRWALASYIEPIPPAVSPAASTVGRVTQQTEASSRAPLARPAAPRPTVPPSIDDTVDDLGFDEDFDDTALLDVDDLVDAPPPRRAGRKPKLRQDAPGTSTAVTKNAAPAWWVGKSREAFQAEAQHQFDTRMRYAKLPARLFQTGGIG